MLFIILSRIKVIKVVIPQLKIFVLNIEKKNNIKYLWDLKHLQDFKHKLTGKRNLSLQIKVEKLFNLMFSLLY